MGKTHTVRFEPVGIEIEVDEDETILNAAFKQGIMLMHGCKEGQCSACKSFLLDGEVDLDRYSTFALPDFEEAEGWTLLCRAHPFSELEVELINYDEEILHGGNPPRTVKTRVEAVEELKSDNRRLHLTVVDDEPFEFKPGQYVDIRIPGDEEHHRSFSMANTNAGELEFMIKLYPGGRFSGLLADGAVKPADELEVTGPYGVFTLRASSPRRLLFIGGGAGMAPILSLLRSLRETESERERSYYYGARTEADLFHVEELEGLKCGFVPALSEQTNGWKGEMGLITEVVERLEEDIEEVDAYVCGPPPMVEATIALLEAKGVPEAHIYYDKFTTTADEGGGRMATEVTERSVPKPVFTDAEAGAKEFPSWQSRSYNYFTPRKRRATVYEDVTIDVQPDPARHLSQGWVYSFANGDAGYPQEWSALKSTNWHAFLDPNEEWEQTIYRNNANVVRQISQNIEHGRTAHVFAAMNPAWVRVLERHMFAWAHAEHGIGLHVYTPAQRDAPTNMINNAMAVGAVHKLRFAQDLILYNLALSEEIPGFDGKIHKATWQEDPIWQPTREFVEKLTGTRDWAEQWFATPPVFEPMLGELFRSGFVMQVAALHGDFVTPTIMGAGESDAGREQRGARVLFRMLTDDAEHGAANKEILSGWLSTWNEAALNAARNLQPIWSQISEKVVR